MSIIIEILVFLVVIIVLILVHEIGHFIVAKLSGMRVDEFGIGYPPRALTLGKIGETEYTLNWLPFGGFVRIYGEDGSEEESETEDGTSSAEEVPNSSMLETPPNTTIVTPVKNSRAFASKPRILQALVLVAGVFMNMLLAYVLITTSLIIGTQQELSPAQEATAKDPIVAISAVAPNSPAAAAGFMVGDEIKSATSTVYTNAAKTAGFQYNVNGSNPDQYAALVSSDSSGGPMSFLVDRNGRMMNITATPKVGLNPSAPTHAALGVTLTVVGITKTSWRLALGQGFALTLEILKETLVGFGQLIVGIVTFHANLSQVSGPVGIAGAVGQATANGFSAIISLAAIISINLAIVNLIPIPALDGGRLLFVIIEAIIRKPIDSKIANRVNTIGFALILLLMVIVTAHDIYSLFR